MLDVHVKQDGSTVTVAPEGELDLASARRLNAPLAAAAEHGVARVLLDLRGLTFIDSSGIGLIMKFQRHYAAEGIAFALIRGGERVQRALELSHVQALLRWADEPPDGMAVS